MKQYLYTMCVDFGRMGDVEGLFVATEEQVLQAIGKTIYLGEVLGKHSDISFTLDHAHLVRIDIGDDVCNVLVDTVGDTTISGYNPLEHITYNVHDFEENIWHLIPMHDESDVEYIVEGIEDYTFEVSDDNLKFRWTCEDEFDTEVNTDVR